MCVIEKGEPILALSLEKDNVNPETEGVILCIVPLLYIRFQSLKVALYSKLFFTPILIYSISSLKSKTRYHKILLPLLYIVFQSLFVTPFDQTFSKKFYKVLLPILYIGATRPIVALFDQTFLFFYFQASKSVSKTIK